MLKIPNEKVYLSLFYQRPYALPFTIAILTTGYELYFNFKLASSFTEEEIGEYIQEVKATEGIFTVSNIINSVDTASIPGLEQFIVGLEDHPLYK